jgi:ParB family chromosome partitioning protein
MTIIKDIPLSQLVPSQANVRRTGRSVNIEELAASIASHGLLQNLTVRETSNGRNKARQFEVIAGARRLAALKLLVKRKSLAVDAPIPCHLIEEGLSEEISLAENTGQCPMHPADQYEAFAKLHHQHGMSAEDIAARFGVTATVVTQRLRLGALSPKLMALYREGELNLEQLSAFCITDDHAAQERVWAELPTYNRYREAILQALSHGQVPSTDRRARFVGLNDYEAAGGIVVRDLFDDDAGGFLNDEALLERLAREKLAKLAEKLSGEGWKWVQIETQYNGSASAGMRRVYPMAVKLTGIEKKRLRKLQARHDALLDRHGEDMPAKAQEQLDNILKAIEALERYEYKLSDMGRAGAILMLDHHGEAHIERGFVLPEDEPKPKSAKGKDKPVEDASRALLSEKLVADLTAHKTAGLRNELALNADTALTATVHALAATTFYFGEAVSCLDIAVRSANLSRHVPDIENSVAGHAIAERHESWAKRLPSEAGELWDFVRSLGQDERLALLAHCVSLSVDALQLPQQRAEGRQSHASALARCLDLDMARYWQPTATGYFARVSKERIAEAVREAVSPEAAENISGMKKLAMADAAEQRVAGKGWLPELLR